MPLSSLVTHCAQSDGPEHSELPENFESSGSPCADSTENHSPQALDFQKRFEKRIQNFRFSISLICVCGHLILVFFLPTKFRFPVIWISFTNQKEKVPKKAQ